MMSTLLSPSIRVSRQRPWLLRAVIVGLTITSLAATAQKAPNVPLISGGGGAFSSTNKGFTFVQPVVAPLLAMPLGDHVLIEARSDIRGLVQQSGPNQSFQGSITAVLEYLQADYVANKHITITAGRFLTPFGTYNERLTALWIRNLQDAPLIFGLGTRTSGSSDGGMIRGNLYANRKVQVDYTAYFSASRKAGQFQAARVAGDRIDLYLPDHRLELGMSYQRFLQSTHYNVYGAHAWWMPHNTDFQLRSEYAHGPHAQGYWVETDWRLSRFGGQHSAAGRLQPLFRWQQTFRNSPGNGDGLPSVDTKQADFGLNYYFPHELRFNSSYSRVFDRTNGNIWDVSLTYRFLFPAWRGKK